MIQNKKIIGTIEARMSSTRLPGKVLMPLAGEPCLKRIVDRMKKSRYIDEVVIATTVNKADNAIIEFCRNNNMKFYRGNEQDVLKRILEAAKSFDAEIIVDVTGDCPLVDFRLIDKAVELLSENKYDFVANTIERSYPDGFDIQVFPVSILEEIDHLTDDPIDRVHGTYYIYKHPERFRLRNIKAEGKMYWPDLRVTLDEINDYKLLNIIFENLLPKNLYFSAKEVVDFLLKNPKLLEININVRSKQPQEG